MWKAAILWFMMLEATHKGLDELMPRTALVVEDNPFVRSVLRLHLERRAWNVGEAQDASSGLMRLRELDPQLVILDLIMPINDGIDAIRLIGTIREEKPDVTLLVFSSVASEAAISRFLEQRGVEFFQKADAEHPSFDRLFERVEALGKELNRRLS